MPQIKTCYTLAELMDESLLEESIKNLNEVSLDEHIASGKTNAGYESFEEAMKDINSSVKYTTENEYSVIMEVCI